MLLEICESAKEGNTRNITAAKTKLHLHLYTTMYNYVYGSDGDINCVV